MLFFIKINKSINTFHFGAGCFENPFGFGTETFINLFLIIQAIEPQL